MLLLDSGETARDPFHRPADPDGPLPRKTALLIPLHRLEEAAQLDGLHLLGVEIVAGEEPETLQGWLPRLDLVAVRLHAAGDGRAFTAARLLRQRMGFTGQLRATGCFHVDQLSYLRRCGFDAFELSDEHSAATAAASLRCYTATYQPWLPA